jgi:hypothetical protein
MRLGIIGLPQSGKTTIFNALTRGDKPTTMSGGQVQVHTAVVAVPDPRVDRLSEIYKPEKTTYARVTYADIAGLEGGKGGISGQLLNEISGMDGLLLVIRCFGDDAVPHPQETVDAGRDVGTMLSELLLNDLILVERKIERLAEERQKGGRDKAEIEREQALFQRLHAALSEEKPLRQIELTAEEHKSLGGYGFLTLKPLLVVLNLGEGQSPPDVGAQTGDIKAIPLQGKLEMELAQMPPGEAGEFLKEYGIDEPSLNRMIRESYELLGLQSFFTVGEDEVRAWTVRVGAKAPEAAGTIHSDLQKGFIRAEVVTYEDIDRLGSMAESRDKGVLRVEGKEYVVQDGDVIHVRFNL